MIPMKRYTEEALKELLKKYRSYESCIDKDWGGKKRLFKCVETQLEIKFCKAQMFLDEALKNTNIQKKFEMVEMMYRAYAALIQKAQENGFTELEDDFRCFKYKDNKIAIVCDSLHQMPRLKQLYGSDKDVVLFSIDEMFRLMHPDYIQAKETFKKRNIDITFKKVIHR